MSIVLISYDLNNPGQDYEKVHEAITRINPNSWARPLLSLWIVETNLSVPQVRDRVQKAMDSNDQLLVVDITGKPIAAFRIDSDIWKWIESKF